MNYSRRHSLYANEATLIEYESGSGLLWWNNVPIGRLISSSLAPETVEAAVMRLHDADVAASAARQIRLARELPERERPLS